jgi:glycosyltransferase involved in cell wall biosynthesis
MEFSVACMKQQTRKPDLWIICENSDDSEPLWEDAGIEVPMLIVRVSTPQTIGTMRNLCIAHALKHNPDYIVFWDDDDYYHPERIQQNIEALQNNPTADISASSKMFLLLTRENVLMTTGPFGEKHGTAATFCIRGNYARNNRFDGTKTRGEEVSFTKLWTANLVQVKNPEKMIVVMGHSKNTVNKSDLLARPKMYNAAIVDDANGRMRFRTQWNVSSQVWDLFRKAFSV